MYTNAIYQKEHGGNSARIFLEGRQNPEVADTAKCLLILMSNSGAKVPVGADIAAETDGFSMGIYHGELRSLRTAAVGWLRENSNAT